MNPVSFTTMACPGRGAGAAAALARRNAYWQAFVAPTGDIHLSWVWRESWDVATNHDLCYTRSSDGGHSWQDSAGRTCPLPITMANAEVAWPIPQHRELMVYRDRERDSRVSLARCSDPMDPRPTWQTWDLTDFSVDSWEPSFDTDLWKEEGLLDLYVQAMGQGDGESLEDLPPQAVRILRVQLVAIPDQDHPPAKSQAVWLETSNQRFLSRPCQRPYGLD